MSRMAVARPYAKAILLNAKAFNHFAQWSRDLATLAFITQQKDMQALLKTNKAKPAQLISIYSDLTASKITSEALNLVKVLAEKKRLAYIPEIACLFEEFKNELENKLVLRVKSTHLLTQAEERNMAYFFEKMLHKEIEVRNDVDQTLMGGFVAKAGNYVLDGSLKNLLTELKEAMGD